MKSTIKIDPFKSIVIEPNKTGSGVHVSLNLFGASMAEAVLTPDQCGALIFALEACDELAKKAALSAAMARACAQAGARCHGDECAAGQLPCPTPGACGVAA